jgi:FixJ family two-component response regulator
MRIQTPKHPILVLEDDPEMLDTYRDILKSLRIEFDLYSSGIEALKAAGKKEFSIFITDLEMPTMHGRNFIENLKSIIQDPVILVATGLDDPETIIEVMKMGVFDYIIKPFNFNQVILVLKKALEYKFNKDQEKIQSKYASEKLKGQIEWLNYKESLRMKDKKESGLKNLEDMKNSFLEGASIGSIMTMVFLMNETKQETENGFLVDKEIFNTIVECNEVCRHQFEGIYLVTKILESNLNFEMITTTDLINRIPDFIEEYLPYFEAKNIKISFPGPVPKAKINISIEHMRDVIAELVINAYKYTVPNSTIFIYAFISEGYLIINVKNDILDDPKAGIPKDYEKLILEPFIRLQPNDESIIKVEKFGIGLGLTVVDNIVKKHNGMFFIHNLTDYTGGVKKNCVVAEMFIPIQTS